MDERPRFQWHPNARLFVGETEILRSDVNPETSPFLKIPTQPAHLAAARLAQVLVAGRPFFVGETELSCVADEGFFLTQTGGSTGAPAILCRSQASWIASFVLHAERFGYSDVEQSAVLGQLGHSLSLYGLIEALHLGLGTHMLGGMRPDQQARYLRDRKITLAYATPTQLHLLCRTGIEMPDLRLLLIGGGPLTPATRSLISKNCPNAEIAIFYGAAETSFITMSDNSTPESSVGKAYHDVTLKIGEKGLIWVKSPYLFDHYLTPGKTIMRDGQGFVAVGELGHLDDDGYLYLRGRADRMVTIADQNVYPEEVENLLMEHDEMPLCAVLPQEDAKRHMILALVVTGTENPEQKERIQQICRDQLPARSVPKRLIFADPFPLLPSGKPDLVKLAQLVERAE